MVSNVRDISHIISQILQIYEFAEVAELDQNPDQTVLIRFGYFTFTFTSSVRFEFGSIPIAKTHASKVN